MSRHGDTCTNTSVKAKSGVIKMEGRRCSEITHKSKVYCSGRGSHEVMEMTRPCEKGM